MTEPASDDDRDRDEGDEPREDDPVTRSMRSVWLSMREEDPPQGGLASLMAAARAKADVMAPAKESWWQRLFATLRRPPVLALATVVLLVGGAVIIGKRQNDMTVERMAPAGPMLDRATTIDPSAVPEPPPAVPAAPHSSAGSTADLGNDQVQAAPTVRRPGKSKPPQRDPIATREKLEEKPELGVGGIKSGSKAGETDQVIATDGEAATTGTATSAPVTPPAQEPGVSRPTTIAQLVKQSAAAAARGDCATVKTTSARIRKLSPAVYNEQIAKNAAIAKCLK